MEKFVLNVKALVQIDSSTISIYFFLR